MNAAATRERTVRGLRERPRRGVAGHGPSRSSGSGERTLQQRIWGTWDRLLRDGTADCPVCAAEILAGQPCAICGSELR